MVKQKMLVVILSIVATLLTGISYFLYREDVSHNGRLYPDRSKLCNQVAIDYLKNIMNEPGYSEEKWNMAVDIETEIHKLCQLEVSKDAIQSYEPTALEKYSLDLTIADQLRDCLPKSDMGSKEKCNQLLNSIKTFNDCVNAGFPVMESFPERCSIPDGRSFTKNTL